METTSYNIGIIGSGAIGGILGTYWAQAGHKVMFSSRNPEKLAKLVEKAGDNSQFGSVEEATAFGDIILLAVNYSSIHQAIEKIKGFVTDKIIIDATNPLIKTDNGYKNMIPENTTAGEAMQRLLPDAKIMKSYTTLWSKYLETQSNKKDGLLVMPLSGGYKEDKQKVTQLIIDSGFHPYDLGGLSKSKLQDPGSAIWNKPLVLQQFNEAIQTS
ncbi:NADPH-dependent F420 reductase [Aquimarina litoralis]|uniref:NADPH-dependent F420 reductase n=1 Tax=Aquimarina litoralis TaxID=584605 RepID=UPI001C56CB93|nr:NAD(P)-binding domain-containing protein [Aquimarina litoralis]MBW1296022.1 dinucleotide-binding enzyme [Aquimarina litoralis]